MFKGNRRFLSKKKIPATESVCKPSLKQYHNSIEHTEPPQLLLGSCNSCQNQTMLARDQDTDLFYGADI